MCLRRLLLLLLLLLLLGLWPWLGWWQCLRRLLLGLWLELGLRDRDRIERAVRGIELCE